MVPAERRKVRIVAAEGHGPRIAAGDDRDHVISLRLGEPGKEAARAPGTFAGVEAANLAVSAGSVVKLLYPAPGQMESSSPDRAKVTGGR